MFERLFSEQGLSLDRLRCLIEVHDAGSIAQAAPGDSVRQSQYSRQLRKLSEFFGCELTERRGRTLSLTTRGEELVLMARAHFAELEDFRASCFSQKMHYMIAGGDSMIQWLLLPRLKEASVEFRTSRFATLNLRTQDVVRHIHDGRAHLGIIRADAVPPDLRSLPIGKVEYSLVMPQPTLGKDSTSIQEALTCFPFASLSSDGKYTSDLQDIFAEVGREYSPDLTCQSFPQILQAIRSGSYCGILPALVRESLPREGYSLLGDSLFDRLSREIALVWSPRLETLRPEFSKLISAFHSALARISQSGKPSSP